MSRIQLLLLATCLVVLSTGCRSRCDNGSGGGWFAGSPRVAPPPTYSLNIPSVAQNQPYYTPGNNASNSSVVDPNLRSPVPVNSQSGEPGWRRSDNNALNSNGTPAGDSRSVLTSPTTFVETDPVSGQPYARSGSATGLPGSGFSYTSSANYQTTRVDERLDSTRLPVTDASSVRAPARNYPTGSVASLAQLQQLPGNYPAGYNVPSGTQQTYVLQNGFNQSVNPYYNGNTMMVNGQSRGPVSYQGQAVLMNPNGYPIRSAPTVVAQSTATFDSNGSGQSGWRDRELNSERF
jgi:hypothetical protein